MIPIHYAICCNALLERLLLLGSGNIGILSGVTDWGNIYSPLQRVLPGAIALIMTFIISGGVHDLVTMALRRSVTFLFTPWFFILGVGVVLGRAVGMDLSNYSWWIRAGINLTYLVVGLAITLIAKRFLAIP
ncbi:MAG: hypothetical protein GY797_40410 [Deltaproteobacteria bacterium]|nr:hypothetical protein [Deltaproteobacteria bacterium]